MKEDNIEALIKESYGITPAPKGLFTRIKDEALNEQAIFAGNPMNNKTIVSLDRLSGKRFAKKPMFIGICAAAACLVICLITLTATGVFSKKEDPSVIAETITETPDLPSTSDTEIPSVEVKANASSNSVVSFVKTEDEDTTDETIKNLILADNSTEFVEYGRKYTFSFGDKVPVSYKLYSRLYNVEGEEQFKDDVPREIAVTEEENGFSFRVEKDFKIALSSSMDYYKQPFYSVYILVSEYEDCTVETVFLVYVGEESEYLMAQVLEASPILVVKPLSLGETWKDVSEIKLLNPEFAKVLNKDGMLQDIEAPKLEAGQIVKINYYVKDNFPDILDGTKVIVNPLDEEFSLMNVNLRELMSGYGEIGRMTYLNLSTGIDEYVTDDKEDIEKFMKLLEKVSVSEVRANELVDGSWEEAGSFGEEMWQISLELKDGSDNVVIRFNPLEIVTKAKNSSFEDAGSNLRLIFDGDDVISTDEIAELAKNVKSNITYVTAETIVDEAADATYEVLSNNKAVKKLKFNTGYSIDLNLDGDYEEVYAGITSEIDTDTYTPATYVLVIDGIRVKSDAVSGIVSPMSDYYFLTDIDSSDPYLELALTDNGPSDDYSTSFFRYEDNKLHYIGKAEGFIATSFADGKIKITGNGTVSGEKRLSLLQTWYTTVDYEVNMGKLVEITKRVYVPTYINTVKLKKDITINSDMDLNSEKVTISKGKVTFPETDDNSFVLVRGEDGTEGYICIDDGIAVNVEGKPWASDLFDDLLLAD